MICKIEQNEDTTYPEISAKRDFSPVFVLILNYVVCEILAIFEIWKIFLEGLF